MITINKNVLEMVNISAGRRMDNVNATCRYCIAKNPHLNLKKSFFYSEK